MTHTTDTASTSTSTSNASPLVVVLLALDRCYGGPEEGGWWWDRCEIVQYAVRDGWQAALATARAMRDDNPSSRFGRYSAAGGTDYAVRVVALGGFEEWAANVECIDRPSYC